jgi:hypothetical protein
MKQKDYLKSIHNFIDKCPVRLDVLNTKEKLSFVFKDIPTNLEFEWEDILKSDKKEWIHNLKLQLEKHYPILIETIYDSKELSAIEMAIKAEEEGRELDKILSVEKKKVAEVKWIMDKVVAWENVVILKKVPEDGKHYKYKFKKILYIFLKKMRSGFWNDEKQLGDYFFQNSELITQD